MDEGEVSPSKDREIQILSGRELTQKLSDPKFRRALTIAASITQNKGYESSFDVLLLSNGQIWIDKVVEGGTDAVENFGVTATTTEVDGFLSEIIPRGSLLTFHFHPAAEGPIIPSGVDLMVLNSQEWHTPYVLMAVGHISRDKKIQFLMISRRVSRLLAESIDRYEELIEGAKTQVDVNQALEEIGLRMIVLSFSKRGSSYFLDENSAKLLEGSQTFEVPIINLVNESSRLDELVKA